MRTDVVRFAQVEGESHLVKDLHTKAVLSTDSAGLAAYRLKKKIIQSQAERLTTLESEVSQLRDLLIKVLNGNSGNFDGKHV
jgi:hypothetical protein